MPPAFDAIVIGSGMGGLAAAAALARRGRRALVLERHWQLGGLTQVFQRREYRFATGVHYLAGMGDAPGRENAFGRVLGWLAEGRLRFAPVGSPYDIVRLPGLEFPIEAPREAFVARLKATFPAEAAAIDAYFAAAGEAERAAGLLFALRALPGPVARLARIVFAGRIRRTLGRSVAEAVNGVRERRLAALLAARWGDYGVPPAQAPFALHALILGSYHGGAYYPVGGPAVIAEALAATVRAAGGELRTSAPVAQIRVERGRATGVVLESGETLGASAVVSAMGARRTAAALPEGVAPAWRAALARLKPGVSYITLYLGFRGDIRAQGASAANVWVYESEDIGRVWERPMDEPAPGLFVSFPTLKDAAHADSLRHTGEVMALARWAPFAAWAGSTPGTRPEEYLAAKAWIAENLLAQFGRHFPRLAPLVDFHEVSTPLSQAAYVGADEGATYGLEMSAARMLDPALRVRTPVPGLLLAGQDAAGPGVPSAVMGGLMAAARLEPRLWRELPR